MMKKIEVTKEELNKYTEEEWLIKVYPLKCYEQGRISEIKEALKKYDEIVYIPKDLEAYGNWLKTQLNKLQQGKTR